MSQSDLGFVFGLLVAAVLFTVVEIVMYAFGSKISAFFRQFRTVNETYNRALMLLVFTRLFERPLSEAALFHTWPDFRTKHGISLDQLLTEWVRTKYLYTFTELDSAGRHRRYYKLTMLGREVVLAGQQDGVQGHAPGGVSGQSPDPAVQKSGAGSAEIEKRQS